MFGLSLETLRDLEYLGYVLTLGWVVADILAIDLIGSMFAGKWYESVLESS